MPSSSSSSSSSTSSTSSTDSAPSSKAPPPQRTTFRPPWVKESEGKSSQGWSLKPTPNRRGSNTSKEPAQEQPNPLAGVQLRKTSVTTKEQPENGAAKENTFKLPQLRPVPPKEEVKPQKERLPQVKLTSVADRPRPPLRKTPTRDDDIDRAIPAARHALIREESMRRLSSAAPMPPPMPPPAPKMPLPPGMADRTPLSRDQMEKIEQLKSRPKVRPDWSNLLKEIESNKKLNHVECNDRSQPLLPNTKATEHFVFESEKPNVHNELLKQIETGFHLKKVKTNDRSKPMLDGLRKGFRRQMTIEEQIQKSVSMASMPPEEIEDEVDEMDDIDKVRDDLQSTKQLLALELRNKEAQIRENKRLLARIQNLEAELEKERNNAKRSGDNSASDSKKSSQSEDKVVQSLKKEAEQARKSAQEVEKKYKEATEELDNTKFQLEETKKQNQQLERRLQDLSSGKRHSIHPTVQNGGGGDESEDEVFDADLSPEESDGEDTPEKREKRAQRELKILRNKLRNYKVKEDNAKKERVALRQIMKTHNQAIKDEKKKYKALKKEVDKMASLMKDAEEDEESEDEVDEEDEEESSEEETSSDDSDDESDSERSQSESEDAPPDKKKSNLTVRGNRHEKILAALKKGNLLLKTNAERLQDDLNKQKEMTAALQEDLDSVLAELG